eukprot:7538404-Heterocapsa_arctica.AAC.1
MSVRLSWICRLTEKRSLSKHCCAAARCQRVSAAGDMRECAAKRPPAQAPVAGRQGGPCQARREQKAKNDYG